MSEAGCEPLLRMFEASQVPSLNPLGHPGHSSVSALYFSEPSRSSLCPYVYRGGGGPSYGSTFYLLSLSPKGMNVFNSFIHFLSAFRRCVNDQ